jgi:hypothetical protein
MYSLAYREVLLSFISAVLKMGRWLDADRLASLFLPSGNKKGEVLPKISKISYRQLVRFKTGTFRGKNYPF